MKCPYDVVERSRVSTLGGELYIESFAMTEREPSRALALRFALHLATSPCDLDNLALLLETLPRSQGDRALMLANLPHLTEYVAMALVELLARIGVGRLSILTMRTPELQPTAALELDDGKTLDVAASDETEEEQAR